MGSRKVGIGAVAEPSSNDTISLSISLLPKQTPQQRCVCEQWENRVLRHASLPHFYLLATPTDHLPDLDLFTDKLDSFEKMCSAEESEGGGGRQGSHCLDPGSQLAPKLGRDLGKSPWLGMDASADICVSHCRYKTPLKRRKAEITYPWM